LRSRTVTETNAATAAENKPVYIFDFDCEVIWKEKDEDSRRSGSLRHLFDSVRPKHCPLPLPVPDTYRRKAPSYQQTQLVVSGFGSSVGGKKHLVYM
jgi:hypothetical protein